MKKSFKKVWQTRYRDTDIVVENAWNLDACEEKIQINGKTVYHRQAPLDSSPASIGWCRDFYENGNKITVKLGSAWHCCGVACQILIDDRHVYGNKIVLFAKKQA